MAEPGEVADKKPDPADPNFVWRRIATLGSFPAYRGKSGPAGGESIFLPIRSKQPTLTPGAYGPLTDMLLNRPPGGGRNQGYAEALFEEFENLAESPHPYLRRVASEFLALGRARFQLAEADEMMGNTPNSSIHQFQQKVFLPIGKYVFQREADRIDLKNRLERAYPEYDFIVHDAPMSAESREHLGTALSGLGGMKDDIKQRSLVSGLLSYADMAQVDRAASLWRTWLIPLAKASGGPPSPSPLVEVEGVWKPQTPSLDRPKVAFTRLGEFRLRNVSGQDLTHAVVELVAENEWGDRAAQYYHFDRFEVAEVARLIPQPRWERRRLPYSNTIKVKVSTWSDQGTRLDDPAELANPTPDPDPAGSRRKYLENDLKYQPEGEALGAVVRNFPFLPIRPDRQRRRLLMVAGAGMTYAVQPSEGAKPLVVRFLGLDEAGSALKLEVFDLVTREPFRPETPVWKATFEPDDEAGSVLRTDAGLDLRPLQRRPADPHRGRLRPPVPPGPRQAPVAGDRAALAPFTGRGGSSRTPSRERPTSRPGRRPSSRSGPENFGG